MDEYILWRGKPSIRIVLYWSIKSLMWFIMLILIALVINEEAINKPEYNILILYIGIGIWIIRVIYFFFLAKTYEYSISNKAVNFKGGIFNRVFKTVPYYKITDVTKSQTLTQRILGISDLDIQTAGSSFAEISFDGLKDADTPKNYIIQMMNKIYAEQKKK